jgi:C4-dicarboxylate transporter DctQ subunit
MLKVLRMPIVRLLGRGHDALSRGGFVIAALLIAIMAAAYCYEIIARYFFNAPTIWASPLVSYALCASIFLALPELTRQGAHVAIDLHDRMVSPRVGAILLIAMRLVASIASFFGAWITGAQCWSEYNFDVWTNSYLPIPKWWLFIMIAYGFFSAGVYFLRQTFGEVPQPAQEPAVS